jgi:hypothetical protein
MCRYDETLIPVDFKTAGQIVDDDILKILVKPMAAGVTVTVLMDCCHSGTVLDLPYRFGADEDRMHLDNGFNMNSLMGGKISQLVFLPLFCQLLHVRAQYLFCAVYQAELKSSDCAFV